MSARVRRVVVTPSVRRVHQRRTLSSTRSSASPKGAMCDSSCSIARGPTISVAIQSAFAGAPGVAWRSLKCIMSMRKVDFADGSPGSPSGLDRRVRVADPTTG
jgi:hypothetical protein